MGLYALWAGIRVAVAEAGGHFPNTAGMHDVCILTAAGAAAAAASWLCTWAGFMAHGHMDLAVVVVAIAVAAAAEPATPAGAIIVAVLDCS